MLSLRVLAGLVIATMAATAAPTTRNSTGFIWNPSSDDQTTCDHSSFAQASGNEAADWRHCAALSSSWASENGTFRIDDVSGDDFIPILNSKGCILGVKAMDRAHGSYIMGDIDVKDILKVALQYFSEGTNLAVEGDVNCTVAAGGRAGLHWQIYGQVSSAS